MGLGALKNTILATCGLLLVCSLASAQTDEQRAGARGLAEQGGAAFDEGRWQDAVDLFTRAQSLVEAPPHLLYIARAQEKLGHLVQAMEAYNKAVRSELKPGGPQAFVSAKAEADKELQALMPRIPQVTITLSGEQGPDVVVKVDGEPLPNALVGVKRPANPGKHTYSAESPTLEAPAITLAVNEGGEATVELILKAKAAAAPAAPVAATPAPAAPPPPASNDDPARERGSSINYPAYGALAAGVIGLGVGTFFAVKMSGKGSDADAAAGECERTRRCDQGDVDHIADLDDQSASAGTVSLISYGVGVVGVGVGVALLLMGGDEQDKSGQATPLSLWASDHQLGILGRF